MGESGVLEGSFCGGLEGVVGIDSAVGGGRGRK